MECDDAALGPANVMRRSTKEGFSFIDAFPDSFTLSEDVDIGITVSARKLALIVGETRLPVLVVLVVVRAMGSDGRG